MRDENSFRTPEWRDKIRQTLHQRNGNNEQMFWRKVEIRGLDECWPWKAWRDKKGYGYVWFREQGRLQAAHRLAYYFTHGVLPSLHICHKCDHPFCCNPVHLFPGTDADNIHDAMTKGRLCKGEDRPQSKLTEENVREIRRLYAEGGISQQAIAVQFGVRRPAIQKIVLRERWKHI